MARPTPAAFGEKYREVMEAVSAARGAERRHFQLTSDVATGVRLVLSEAGDVPMVFSLWALPQDVAELCGDASVPAAAALLAIDEEQARELRAAGVSLDLSQFSRSQSRPDVYYTLFDRASPSRIHTALHRLVPSLEPHTAVA
ncbi:MAG: hypothetical protein GX624_08975 [Actinobacteria bacterium]|nr:hypothetical protein [Actinomycetota bacterium]